MAFKHVLHNPVLLVCFFYLCTAIFTKIKFAGACSQSSLLFYYLTMIMKTTKFYSNRIFCRLWADRLNGKASCWALKTARSSRSSSTTPSPSTSSRSAPPSAAWTCPPTAPSWPSWMSTQPVRYRVSSSLCSGRCGSAFILFGFGSSCPHPALQNCGLTFQYFKKLP